MAGLLSRQCKKIMLALPIEFSKYFLRVEGVEEELAPVQYVEESEKGLAKPTDIWQKLCLANGDVGRSTLTNNCFKTYEGTLTDSKQHGFGITKTSSFVHVGRYSQGLRQGFGITRFANGSIHVVCDISNNCPLTL